MTETPRLLVVYTLTLFSLLGCSGSDPNYAPRTEGPDLPPVMAWAQDLIRESLAQHEAASDR